MNIFSRRPAALAAALCIPISFAAAYLDFAGRVILLIGVIAFSAAAAVHTIDSGVRIASMRVFSFVLIAGAMSALQLLTSIALYDFNIARFERCAADGTELCLDAVITDVRNESDWYASYEITLRSIDGKGSFSTGLLLCDKAYALSVGDEISCTVGFIRLDEVMSDIGIDRLELAADGVRFACKPVSEVVKTGTQNTPKVAVAKLRTTVGAAIGTFTDSDTAAVIRALLLSDKSGLGVLRRDMSRSGVSHLLALSGLHLSVISAIIAAITKLMLMKKFWRAVCQVVGAVLFLAAAAFPYSLLRATVMLLLLNLGRFVGRDRDSVTSLFMACWLIVLADPAALHDVGFQLSVTATFGVLTTVGSERPVREFMRDIVFRHPIAGIPRDIFFCICVTLGASLLILPLQWIHFGEMSLASLPATLLLAPAVSLILWLSVLFAAAACLGFESAAFFIGRLISMPAGFIRNTAAWISALPVMISLRYKFVLIFIAGFILTAVILRRVLRAGFLKLICAFSVFVTLYIGTVTVREAIRAGNNELYFLNCRTNDAAVVYSAGKCLLADMSEGSVELMKQAAWSLPDHRITEIDTILLTHLHRAHAKSLARLCELRMVRRFLLPEPMTDYEIACVGIINEVAERCGVGMDFYRRSEIAGIGFENVHISVSSGLRLGRSSHPVIGVDFDLGSERVFYAGASIWETGICIDADTVVVGTHGPKIKSDPVFDVPKVLPVYEAEFNVRVKK